MSRTGLDIESSKPVYVDTHEAIAYGIIFANLVNLFLTRLGTIPDILQLATAVPAFLWTVNQGVNTRRISLFLLVMSSLFGIYLVYSVLDLSYQGFRNTVSVFVAATTFLFFFRASESLLRSDGFLIALVLAFGSFILIWDSPFGVRKNNINAAMCYYLTAIVFCYTGMRRLRTSLVTLLFLSMFTLSVINGHRTLAGASVLLLVQYLILTLNIARRLVRHLMFVGLIAVVAGVIAVLVDEDLTFFVEAVNRIVTGEGGRTLMSGRQVTWPIVWDAITSHAASGMGPGVAPGDLYSTNYSAHNLYLQVALQIGYLGFVLLFLLFWSLWWAARPTGAPGMRAAENLITVMITMVVVHSLFEVFLTQNALALGIPVWMVLGLGLGQLNNEAARLRPAHAAGQPPPRT